MLFACESTTLAALGLRRRLRVMLAPATILGVGSALTWGYLFLGRGFFWRISQTDKENTSDDFSSLRVAAVVPARDEATVIGPVVSSLLSWCGIRLPLFLVNGGSSDTTVNVARKAAEDLGLSDSLTIIESAPLPPGWTVKLWALQTEHPS